MKRLTLAAAAAVLFCASRAEAGVRPYAYIQGFDSLSEMTLELENWFSVRTNEDDVQKWDWWLGPVVGVTDRFEASLFAIFTQEVAPEGVEGTEPLMIQSLRLQLSYQLADKGAWPIDVRLRGEFGQPLDGGGHTAWVSAIGSLDLGPLNFSPNLGVWVKNDPDELVWYFDYGLGASVEAVRGLRLGGEFFGTKIPGEPNRMTAGPSLAYGFGRVWLSANVGLGITDASAPLRGRLVFGVLF
jgi:hypothetical protein